MSVVLVVVRQEPGIYEAIYPELSFLGRGSTPLKAIDNARTTPRWSEARPIPLRWRLMIASRLLFGRPR